MKKRIMLVSLLLLTALLFAGCTMQTVEEMYALPKRSKEYQHLQSAIDAAMTDLTYSAPQSGENQQTVQTADLDGDGTDEYLVFAAGGADRPLQVLIFRQEEESGACRLVQTIDCNGTAFEQVEYVNFDENPGCELVFGCKVSDQLLRNVSVYTFNRGSAELLLLNGYARFVTCDLDEDGSSELMVFRPGEAETDRGMAVLYSYQNGQIQRSVETELSEDCYHIRRITTAKLQDGTPAVYVASSVDENAIVTDIFAMAENRLANISFSSVADTSIRTLLNFYVYAEDVDNDGVMELPSLINMKPVSDWQDQEQRFLLRWYSIDIDGWEMDKLFTFHNFVGGWFMALDSNWASWVTVDQHDSTYTFYLWDETYRNATPLFRVYVLTGNDRDEEAVHNGRFALYRTEGVAYAARLEPAAMEYGITEEKLAASFHLIRQG